ncbi:MAG: hypothetical protein M0R80_00045 [Proteobacteria bacterium]|jgi:hypothetical protein|nr:hypothetical protein [Pseudomonadota bacterium]
MKREEPVLEVRALAFLLVCLMSFAYVLPANADDTEVRKAISSRFEIENGKLILQLDAVDSNILGAKEFIEWSFDDFAERIGEVSGIPDYVGELEIEEADEWLDYEDVVSTAESEYCTVQFNQYEMIVAVRDNRGYDVDWESVSEEGVDEDELRKRSEEILWEFGALPEETQDIRTAYLMSGYIDYTKAKDGFIGPEKYSRRAVKVIIERIIGGIPVLGDRMVFSYALDGGFRKLIGQWKRIDFSESVLGISMTEEDFKEKALDYLEEKQMAEGKTISINTDLPIVLGTHYMPVEIEPGVYGLEIQGYARVTIRGPENSTKQTIYSFELY